MKRKVNNTTITATKWEKHGQRRIYFKEESGSRNAGQACWDLQAGEWVKVHGEFGPKFKAAIKDIFADMM